MSDKITRRQALRLALVGGLGSLAAACGARTTPSLTQQTQTEIPPTLVTPTVTSAPALDATVAPATPTIMAAQAADSLALQIAHASNQFLDSLDNGKRAKATYAFTDAERTRWHWTTASGFPRNGLPLKEMNAEQRTQALALLRASVSEYGYKKALDIMSLQRDLGNDPDLYYVTVFGTPGGKEPWGWRWEGHHLSRHFTVVGEQVTMTPFFLGAWPTIAKSGLRAMDREENAARELVRSLDDAKRKQAIFQERTLTQHITQNQAYVRPLDPVGIPAGEFNSDQKKLMMEIIQDYLGTLPENIAAPLLDRIQQGGIENIRFGWAGSLEPRQPQYYRLQGPSFLLEFDNSRNGGTHIHSVWRDFAGDFGQNLSS